MNRKVAIIGSGNWGTTVSKLIAENLNSKTEELADYDNIVEMYVYEEILPDNSKLSDFINKYRQNIKYLPNHILPDNVHAEPDILKAVENATDIVLVTPHQFAVNLLTRISKTIKRRKDEVYFINLSKGVHFDPLEKKIWRVTEIAKEILDLPEDNIAALSGPNVAKDIAAELFTETVIASTSDETVRRFQTLFEKPYFVVRSSNDVAGVEFGGALKNIVAIAAGFIDGFKLGSNSKATIIRIGMEEMYKFAKIFETDVNPASRETFNGPAFLGDIMTTCYGGRNRLYGEALGVCFNQDLPPVNIDVFEKSVLKGQIVQGFKTTFDVYTFLDNIGIIDEYPLFKLVYDALQKEENPKDKFIDIINL